MKALIAFAASLGLLQNAGVLGLANPDFNDSRLQASDATGGSGGAGPSRIDAWYTNAPVGDTCSWYRKSKLTGPDELAEPLVRYRDPSGSTASSDTRA